MAARKSPKKQSEAKPTPAQPRMSAKQARAAFMRESELRIWPRYGHYYRIGARMDVDFGLSHKLVRTARAWTNLVDGLLRQKTGQSRARWEMLFAIAFSAGPVTMTEVSEKMGVQWPTLVRLMNELEHDGLIERYDNPADKRSRLIELTQRGIKTIDQIRSTIDPLRHHIMSVLSEEEVRQCTRLLDRVKCAIEAYGAIPPGEQAE